MTVNDKTKDRKLQHDTNRDASKISALSFGKVDKYEYIIGEEILPLDQSKVIEPANHIYSPLGKAFEKQIKKLKNKEKTKKGFKISWNQRQLKDFFRKG